MMRSAEAKADSDVWRWPADSSNRVLTQGFGAYDSGKFHGGIDINGPDSNKTNNVYPTKPGTVIMVYTGCNSRSVASTKNNNTCSKTGNNPCHPNTGNFKTYKVGSKKYAACNFGFGNGVVIDHHDGTYSSYAHMREVYVEKNDDVTTSTCLGKIGWTGNAGGRHLHFTVGRGVAKDGKHVHVTNYINPNPASTSLKIKWAGGNSHGLLVSGGYAYDNGKNSGGNGLNYTFSSVPTPGVPTLTVTSGTSLTNTTFRWSSTANTTYYTLRVFNSDGSLYKMFGGLTGSSYSIVLPSGSYSATVAAVNTTYNNWSFSSAASFTVRAESTNDKPGKPTLKVYTGGETSFEWNKTANTEYYTIRIFDSSGNLYRIRGGWRYLHFEALLPPGRYSATLASVNSKNSTWTFSDEVSFTVPAVSAPSDGSYVAGSEVNHKIYNLYQKDYVYWTDAEAIAKNSGGRLAVIRDSEEQDVIGRLVGDFDHSCWIGAEAFRNDEKWRWIDGSSMTFTNWAEDQPDNGYGLENCVEILPTGEWNDMQNFWYSSSDSSQNVYGYILEFEPLSILADLNVDTIPAGTNIRKGDVIVFVSFADQSLWSTDDYEVSVSGTTPGTQTVTVKYGKLTTTLNVEYVDPREMSSSDFDIPESTSVIGEEAFRNCDMRVVHCPEGLTGIGSDAFADCENLEEVYIPASVTEIDGDIFAGCPADLTIFGAAGSAAEEFAEVYNYQFMITD